MTVSSKKQISITQLQDGPVVEIVKDFTAAIRNVLTEVKENMPVMDEKIGNFSLEIQNKPNKIFELKNIIFNSIKMKITIWFKNEQKTWTDTLWK